MQQIRSPEAWGQAGVGAIRGLCSRFTPKAQSVPASFSLMALHLCLHLYPDGGFSPFLHCNRQMVMMANYMDHSPRAASGPHPHLDTTRRHLGLPGNALHRCWAWGMGHTWTGARGSCPLKIRES